MLKRCARCGGAFEPKFGGRRGRYCSRSCEAPEPTEGRDGVVHRVAETRAESAPQPIDFVWVKVNEIAWKLTNGEMTVQPAVGTMREGYQTAKAIAWITDVGLTKTSWVGRYQDMAVGPTTIEKAKKAVLKMVRGHPVRGERVTDPVNQLTRWTLRAQS